eukprot:SAG22_NODE_650_length_8156_cov_10.637830_3_plen_134_part_00
MPTDSVSLGLTATVGTPHFSEAKQHETMLYGDHQYAVVRCEMYKNLPCFVVRNPHNNLPLGIRGEHKLRLRSEIREMHSEADRHTMEVTGAFARGVFMTKDEMMQPGMFATCTVLHHLQGFEEVEHRAHGHGC